MNKALISRIIPVMVSFVLLLPSISRASVDEMVSDALSKVQPTLGKISDDMKVVAVYSIGEDKSGKVNVQSLQDRIISILLKTEKFQVIDRANLKRLLEEQALSMTGVVDEAQMVKAGKLIGVKGFFFGSVDVREESVIISLKLVSVESSAIVWSKEFVGEAASAAKLGIGWGVCGVPVTAKYSAAKAGQAGFIDGPTDKSATGVSILNLMVSYKQGQSGWKWGLFGADAAFSYFTAPEDITYNKTLTISGHPANTYQEYELARISLRPKLFFSSKGILGWEKDWINPYLGLSLDLNLFNLLSQATNITPQQEGRLTSFLFSWGPLAGVELNLTNSLTMFAEGVYIPAAKTKADGPDPMADLELRTTSGVDGMAFNAGIKYFFSMGGTTK